MSRLLKIVLASAAQEHDRLLQAGAAIAAISPVSQFGVLATATASSQNLVDCTSAIMDPEGAGGLVNWSASHGVMQRISGGAPNGWETTDPDAGYVEIVGDGSGQPAMSATTDGPDPLKTKWNPGDLIFAYAFCRGDQVSVLSIVGATSSTIYASQELPPSAGWMLVSLAGVGPVNEGLVMRYSSTSTTAKLDLTGATLANSDPGGPFSGDTVDEANFVYRWQGSVTYSEQGVRNHSRSLRFGRNFDLLAVAEKEANIDIAPLGLSIDQRARYLHQRFQARHQPWSSTLVAIIVDLIQTENPSFSAEHVYIDVDAPGRSFTVSIGYNPDGLLVERIRRLIREESPLHLNFQGLSLGGFLADISHAGDPL